MAYRTHCLICTGTGCVSSGANRVDQALQTEIARQGLTTEVQVVRTGCQGFCAAGPVAVVQPEGVFYCLLKEPDAATLVGEHLLKGPPRLDALQHVQAGLLDHLVPIPLRQGRQGPAQAPEVGLEIGVLLDVVHSAALSQGRSRKSPSSVRRRRHSARSSPSSSAPASVIA